MKTKLFITSLAALLMGLTACDKQESAPSTAANPAERTAAATTAVAQTPAKVDEAAQSAQTAAEQVASVPNQEAQGLLDKAKAFIAEKKYQDALALLNKASAMKLTPEQQAFLDQLKAQIQAALNKAASGNVGSTIDGVLGGKK